MPKTKTPTDNDKAGEISWDENIRIDKIIWLAGCNPNPPRDLVELGEWGDELDRLLGKGFQAAFDSDPEELLSKCNRAGKLGFLVEIAVPVPTFYKSGSISYSWGHCYTRWFYTETVNLAFMQEAKKWKDTRYAEVQAVQAKGEQE